MRQHAADGSPAAPGSGRGGGGVLLGGLGRRARGCVVVSWLRVVWGGGGLAKGGVRTGGGDVGKVRWGRGDVDRVRR